MMSRSIRDRLAILLMIASAALTVLAPTADAQTAVVGTADFRNAPQLVPGTYTERLVTGDSAWYSIMYANGTDYEFDVQVAGGAPAGVQAVVSLVAPTLATVDGPSSTVAGGGAVYPTGQTNIWFLKVSLETTSQLGVEYPVTLSVAGVESTSTADCADIPGCDLAGEYATLEAAVTRAEQELSDGDQLETAEEVTRDIESLRGFGSSAATRLPEERARLERNEAIMAQLCAPEPMCETFPDPGSKTPLLGLLVGLAALAGGAYVAVTKLRGEPDPELEVQAHAPAKPKKQRRSSAIERARSEGAARRKAEKKRKRK